MTTTTTTELETAECWCGVPLALPANLVRNARENGTSLYCPATGHRFGWNSENDKLRKQLDRQRARTTAVEDQLRAAERTNAALRGAATKARKRAANGVCPCCKRSFVQLARHMASQHPDFAGEGN